MRIGLVGCVSLKRTGPAQAAEIYISPLFRGRREVVEQTCDRWFILSAKHGLVSPDTVLEPYDLPMSRLNRAARRAWAGVVLRDLLTLLGLLENHEFEIHAGADYVEFGLQSGLEADGARVFRPTKGLALGSQLSWYRGWSADTDRRQRPRQPERKNTGDRSPRGKYEPLTAYLDERDERATMLRFDDIELIIGAALPRSAHVHRPWWANGGHTQARGWLDAGYEVETVDLRGQWVRFRRVGT